MQIVYGILICLGAEILLLLAGGVWVMFLRYHTPRFNMLYNMGLIPKSEAAMTEEEKKKVSKEWISRSLRNKKDKAQ